MRNNPRAGRATMAFTRKQRKYTMARKGGPALYELLTHSKRGSSAPTGAPPHRPAGAGSAGLGAMGAGGRRAPFDPARSQWIAWALVCLVAVVVAYLVGVSRGERLGRTALSQEREEEQRLLAAERPAVRPAEQPVERPAPPAGATASPRVETQPIAPPAAPDSNVRVPSSENRPSGQVAAAMKWVSAPLPAAEQGVDPRQAGLNYFVIATVIEPSAAAIVQFCREKGLDAYAVAGNNGRFFEVVVLPGFPASERSSAAVKSLQDRIRNIGVLYANAGRNNPDFGDAYPKLYKP